MNDRTTLVNRIVEVLGSVCDRDLAERLFDRLRADELIGHCEKNGLFLYDDVDLVGAAAQLSREVADVQCNLFAWGADAARSSLSPPL